MEQREDAARLLQTNTPAVYTAISAVQAALAKQGIAKARKNAQQGYQFRGIDDVYSALAPLLAQHGLCILPRVLSRSVTERATQRGGALFYVAVDVEFDFVAAADASLHTVRVQGEAMDSGDKATNKAMSAAYKYACLQAFCIPTEGDNDADATSHEVRANSVRAAAEFDLQSALASIEKAPDESAARAIARDAWTRCPVALRDALKSAVDARLAAFGGGEG